MFPYENIRKLFLCRNVQDLVVVVVAALVVVVLHFSNLEESLINKNKDICRYTTIVLIDKST